LLTLIFTAGNPPLAVACLMSQGARFILARMAEASSESPHPAKRDPALPLMAVLGLVLVVGIVS
jgi:hypothetical protein